MLGVHLDIVPYLERLKAEIGRVDPEEIRRLGDLVFEAYRDGRFVFLAGNGGSACTSSHLAEDLGKNCLRQEDMVKEGCRRLKVMSLTDNVGWITALGNDLGYDQIFLQQLVHYASPGDVLIAISGSGNSPNILAAVDWANRHGLKTFGLTGFGGGKLKQMQQDGVHVRLDDMGMVESVYSCIAHWVVDDLHARVQQSQESRVKSREPELDGLVLDSQP
ncbi:MAG: SIS domain-containing protein [Rhodopirellula sp.]|nr:SIS domain-containing protein [Rhodopirellula sp.]